VEEDEVEILNGKSLENVEKHDNEPPKIENLCKLFHEIETKTWGTSFHPESNLKVDYLRSEPFISPISGAIFSATG
jgi:hypothetical protein